MKEILCFLIVILGIQLGFSQNREKRLNFGTPINDGYKHIIPGASYSFRKEGPSIKKGIIPPGFIVDTLECWYEGRFAYGENNVYDRNNIAIPPKSIVVTDCFGSSYLLDCMNRLVYLRKLFLNEQGNEIEKVTSKYQTISNPQEKYTSLLYYNKAKQFTSNVPKRNYSDTITVKTWWGKNKCWARPVGILAGIGLAYLGYKAFIYKPSSGGHGIDPPPNPGTPIRTPDNGGGPGIDPGGNPGY